MRKETPTTYSNQLIRTFTIEDIKKISDMVIKKEEKSLPKKLSWFNIFMNMLGWHRKYELIVIDKSKLRIFDYPKRIELLKIEKNKN